MSAYTIEVSFTPVCTSCGNDLQIGSTVTHGDGESFTRKDRKVFVYACPKCFEWKGQDPENPL